MNHLPSITVSYNMMPLSVSFDKNVMGIELGRYPKEGGIEGENAVNLIPPGLEGNFAVGTAIIGIQAYKTHKTSRED